MSKNWNVKNNNGDVLYSGTAPTKKEFIAQLIKEKKDLSHANLSRLSLNNLDLKGALLSYADLSGCDFTGSDLSYADLSNSKLQPVQITKYENGIRKSWMSKAKLIGCNLSKANLNGADLTRVNSKGATLESANLNGCIIDFANFSEISASRSSWMFTKGTDVIFQSSRLVNADFYGGRFIRCDFKGADISHQIFSTQSILSRNILENHLHNRTEDAIFVASIMDKETILSHTVPGLVKDSKFNERFSKFGWVSSTLGGALIADKGLETFNELMGEHVHHIGGAAILVIGGVALLAKEVTSEYIKDHTKEYVNQIALKSREILKTVKKGAREKIDLVALVAQRKTLSPVKMALLSSEPTMKKKGIFSTIKEGFIGKTGSVIVCDRKHLSHAMKILSMHRDNIYPIDKDVTLIMCDGPHDNEKKISPCVIRFSKDGSMTTVWARKHEHIVVKYDNKGKIESCWDDNGNSININDTGLDKILTRQQTIDTFEKYLLSENGLFNFTYDRKTHHIKSGMKNSILVYRNQDKLLDNMDNQPAILTETGRRIFAKRGGILKEKGQPIFTIMDAPTLKL